MSTGPLEPMAKMCPTCPFRREGYTTVRGLLEHRALNEATPICHSTGPDAIVKPKQVLCKEPLACRGARNLQLEVMAAFKVIAAPTDECWRAKVREYQALGLLKNG